MYGYDYCEPKGGSILVMGGEGTETQSFAHLNRFIGDYGVTLNHDALVRTVYYKDLYYPKVIHTLYISAKEHGVIT
jgi:hypothetical protein